MEAGINRLLMAFEQQMRGINRDILNRLIEELNLEQLLPMQHMVAEARGVYLKSFLEVAAVSAGSLPDDPTIKRLHQHRLRYEELLEGAQALEAAIQRGYLDIALNSGA